MNMHVPKFIASALQLVRDGKLKEATAEIQSHLSGQAEPTSETAETKARPPLGEAVNLLQAGRRAILADDAASRAPTQRDATLPEGAQFLARNFACPAGRRSCKIYVPGILKIGKPPLLIMLHGCKQNADDFALGTRMNAVAEAHGLLVAYPTQPKSANGAACWNWFNPQHQARGKGEPAIIAALTQSIIAEYNADPARVFIAGLSAGGAMAAVMGATYPEIYAAIGVHSGLPYRAAQDVASAFAAMKGQARSATSPHASRLIVFHGDADATVHPGNGRRLMGDHAQSLETTGTRNGRRFTQTLISDGNGGNRIEHWEIHGAGHAWSGGDKAGSYADPKGPDASEEMARFFLKSGAAPAE